MSQDWEALIEEAKDEIRARHHRQAESILRSALDVARNLPIEQRTVEVESQDGSANKRSVDLPDTRPVLIAMTLEHLADLFSTDRRLDEAADHYRQVLELREKHLGPKHHYVVKTLFDLAGLAVSQQDLDAADGYHRRAVEIAREVLEEADLATILHHHGTQLNLQEKHDEAAPVLGEALEIRLRSPGTSPFDLLANRTLLAESYEALGQPDQAEQQHLAVLDVKAQMMGENHVGLLPTLECLQQLYGQAERHADGLKNAQRRLEIQAAQFGDSDPRLSETLRDVGSCAAETDDYQLTRTCYERMIPLLEKQYGKHSPDLLPELDYLVELYRYLGDEGAADKSETRAAKIRKKNGL